MVVGGVRYNYVKNAQNDIIGLIEEMGKRVVSYKYDSWDKTISTTGTLAATIGKKNPFRYRGYYFDAESGMYYLQSRYYDPEIRRFISADDVDVLDADEDFYYKNLYAYCDSNSVGRTDEAGNMWAVAIPGMAMMAAAFAEVLIPVTIAVTWKNNIAKKKGANDAKKAAIFTKIGRKMAVAIKEGGSANPDNNSKLRDIIAEAKANNVPNDNIKRMIDRFSGDNGSVNYEANTYEGYGPSGIAVICETLTDNRNRTVADVRHYFDKFGAGLGNAGCVSWQFEQKGVIIIERGELDEDEVMMTALDAGADDFQADEELFQVFTAPEEFSAVREALEAAGLTFASAEVEMVPSNTITLEKEEDMARMRKLLDALEENDDVQHVWHNWENEDDYEG